MGSRRMVSINDEALYKHIKTIAERERKSYGRVIKEYLVLPDVDSLEALETAHNETREKYKIAAGRYHRRYADELFTWIWVILAKTSSGFYNVQLVINSIKEHIENDDWISEKSEE